MGGQSLTVSIFSDHFNTLITWGRVSHWTQEPPHCPEPLDAGLTGGLLCLPSFYVRSHASVVRVLSSSVSALAVGLGICFSQLILYFGVYTLHCSFSGFCKHVSSQPKQIGPPVILSSPPDRIGWEGTCAHRHRAEKQSLVIPSCSVMCCGNWVSVSHRTLVQDRPLLGRLWSLYAELVPVICYN